MSIFSKPADVPFLIRLGLCGLVTGICAFVARVASEIMIRTGIGYEANPFSLFPPFEVSGLVIAVTVGFAFSLLFLWGQMQPQYEKWAEAVAIVGSPSARYSSNELPMNAFNTNETDLARERLEIEPF